jgi:hypothetical protein
VHFEFGKYKLAGRGCPRYAAVQSAQGQHFKENQGTTSFQQKRWFKINLKASYITLEKDILLKIVGKELGVRSFLSEALSALAAGEALQGLRNPGILVR